MTSTVFCPDIECDSCVRLISKRLRKRGVEGFSIDSDAVSVERDDDLHKVVGIIRDLGYRASTEPFERKSFGERIRHFKENPSAYSLERQGMRLAFSTFSILLALAAFSFVFLFSRIDGFLADYGWWWFYLIVSVAAISVATWHYAAYKGKVTCMTGMMIGMTFGMQTGMMVGAVIGATNGFFWGAMVGMLLGTAIGVVTGMCCGVMGVMEGAMAGIMGGTMGPMITVMMFSDHVLWFMPFYMLINLFIMVGLSYMLYEEVVEGKEVVRRPVDGLTVVSLAVIITAALTALMIYGPSSALISF